MRSVPKAPVWPLHLPVLCMHLFRVEQNALGHWQTQRVGIPPCQSKECGDLRNSPPAPEVYSVGKDGYVGLLGAAASC